MLDPGQPRALLYLPDGRSMRLPAPHGVSVGEIRPFRGLPPVRSRIWTPGLLKHRARSKTVTMRNGERALVTVDDSGTVFQREHGDVLDAVVRPKTIRLKVRRIA